MFPWWRPIEANEDTPPHLVMRGCEELGFQKPLEVRWHRLSRFRSRYSRSAESLRIRILDLFFWPDSPREIACVCDQPLPVLQRFTLKVLFEPETQYLLGQCCQCRTIFWEIIESPRLEPPAGIWWD